MKSKRLLLVTLVGAALLSGAACYIYFWQSRPIGSGPTGPTVPREAFAKKWSDKEVLLVGMGDSVTAGFGARRGYSYFDRLVANPRDEYAEMREICLRTVFPHLTSTNLSVSGSTSLEHIEKQLPKLPVVGSNVLAIVVMTTGGNDLIHNYGRTPPRDQAMYGATWEEAQPWIAGFKARLDSMVDQIANHFPGGCEIFIADIYDPTDGRGDIERAGLPPWKDAKQILAAYNDTLHKLAQKSPHIHIVNMRDLFLGHGIHCTQFWLKHYDSSDPHYWYYVNLEDPNERGYDALRRLFLIEMQKTLASPK